MSQSDTSRLSPGLLEPAPLVTEPVDFQRLDDDINRPLESFPTTRWWMALGFTGTLALVGLVSVVITVVVGIGTWGNNTPVGWGWAITNFVFWIGIGHAGTLISAILYLLRQKWRTGIARFAEAMTLFAVICALQFPLIHTGRPWLAWYHLAWAGARGWASEKDGTGRLAGLVRGDGGGVPKPTYDRRRGRQSCSASAERDERGPFHHGYRDRYGSAQGLAFG